MPDGPDTLEKLLARADAAAREARSLIEKNQEWQLAVHAGLRRMMFRSRFEPKTLRFYSPTDFIAPLLSGQAAPPRELAEAIQYIAVPDDGAA